MKTVIGIVMLLAMTTLQAQSAADYSYFNELYAEIESDLKRAQLEQLSSQQAYEIEGYLLDARFNSRLSMLTGFMFLDDALQTLDK